MDIINIYTSSLLLFSVLSLFFFMLLLKIKRFQRCVFVDYGFIISVILSANLFFFMIMFLAISDFQVFDILMVAGLILISNTGIWVLINGISKSIISSQKNGLNKFLLLFVAPFSFMVFGIGAFGILLNENFILSLTGSAFGLVIGFLTALIAHGQELPKWKRMGFSMAKSLEERKIVEKNQIDSALKTEKSAEKYSVFGSYAFYFLIFAAIALTAGAKMAENTETVIVAACVFFVPSMFVSYIFLAMSADKKIRANFRK